MDIFNGTSIFVTFWKVCICLINRTSAHTFYGYCLPTSLQLQQILKTSLALKNKLHHFKKCSSLENLVVGVKINLSDAVLSKTIFIG